MSVMFDSTSLEDHEYMFDNDLGIIDDLTLDKNLRQYLQVLTMT
jgi:hypothetical protein